MTAVTTATMLMCDKGQMTDCISPVVQQVSREVSGVVIGVEAVVLVLVIISSLLANCLVFCVFYRRPLLLTMSNRFVLNLAVSNFLMAMLIMPCTLIAVLKVDWSPGTVMCQVLGTVTLLLIICGILTLLLIAGDRWYAVIKPLHYNMGLTARHGGLLIILVWIISLAFSLPPLIGIGNTTFQQPMQMCLPDWTSMLTKDRAYTFFFVLSCFVMPFGIMLGVYLHVFRAAQNNSARTRRSSIQQADWGLKDGFTLTRQWSNTTQLTVTNNTQTDPPRRPSAVSLLNTLSLPALRERWSFGSGRGSILGIHRDDRRAAKTALVVMSTFLLCWCPFFTMIVLEAFQLSVVQGKDISAVDDLQTAEPAFTEMQSARTFLPRWFQTSAMLVAFFGCALNPLVYVFRSSPIKHETAKLLRLTGGCSLLGISPVEVTTEAVTCRDTGGSPSREDYVTPHLPVTLCSSGVSKVDGTEDQTFSTAPLVIPTTIVVTRG